MFQNVVAPSGGGAALMEPDSQPSGVICTVGTEEAHTPEEVVYLGVRYLANVCDGAQQNDGQGYNRLHAGLGHDLAMMPINQWSPRQYYAARKMLETYKKRQLAFLWEHMPPLPPEPPKDADVARKQESYEEYKRRTDPTWEPPKQYREVGFAMKNGTPVLLLRQNFDEQLIEGIKALPQRRYDTATQSWYVPLQVDSLEQLVDFAVTNGYDIDERVQDAIDKILAEFAGKIALSSAASGDFDLDLPPGLSLFPFQKAGVKYAMEAGNVLIADEMGLGKTVQALATIKLADAFPAIVICPASLKRNWEREAQKWLPGKKITVLNGGVKPLRFMGKDAFYDVVIVNYNARILEKWLHQLTELNPKAIICDEAHNCKNPKAQQTKLVDKLLQDCTQARRIFLSGTPVVNRPMEFWQLVKMLGHGKSLGGWAEFKRRYDTDPPRKDRLHELNVRARTHFMVRRLKADVLKELPAKQRAMVPIEISNRQEYTNAERDIAGYFATKKSQDAQFLREIERYADGQGLSGLARQEFLLKAKQQHFTNTYMMASRAEQLLRWEACKQLAVKGKMPGVMEWIADFLADTDQKLVVFALHTDIVEGIARKFNAPYIHGGIPPDARMSIVDRFQNDPTCRVIVGNMQAMGEGLTLTAASNVAFVEYGWNPKTHDQAEDRCHRIGQTDSVNIWNLVAENTIDEELAQMIASKREVVDSIQDGDGVETQSQMMAALQERLDAKLGRSSERAA